MEGCGVVPFSNLLQGQLPHIFSSFAWHLQDLVHVVQPYNMDVRPIFQVHEPIFFYYYSIRLMFPTRELSSDPEQEDHAIYPGGDQEEGPGVPRVPQEVAQRASSGGDTGTKFLETG